MPRTLLLADDSITIQRVVGITFANEDYEITTVDNGDDAVVKAKEIKPDIILADVIMPKRNGNGSPPDKEASDERQSA